MTRGHPPLMLAYLSEISVMVQTHVDISITTMHVSRE